VARAPEASGGHGGTALDLEARGDRRLRLPAAP
jgi:hypothetical protein